MDAKPMSAEYNERVACWTVPCIKESLPEIEKYIKAMDQTRFHDEGKPFVVAEYGCATGFASIGTLQTIIRTVKGINSNLAILIYLNDLPENHH